MPDGYHELLDAAILHLQDMKSRSVKHVSVGAKTLAALTEPVRSRPAAPAAKTLAETRPLTSNARSIIPEKSVPTPTPTPPSQSTPAPTSPPIMPTAPVSKPKLAPAEKEAAFAELRARVLACVKCPHLASSRQNVVFGVGDIHAELMFVGEAPGADEDAQGEPFVGKAGQLLTKIIQTMGLSRERVYIANILKCRPDTPGQSAGNRKPTPAEMDTCKPHLLEQIDLIQPRAIVALGATAIEGLLGKTRGITQLRGQWQEYHGTPLMPTFHPAYLLRNQALSEKRKVWEDMLKVMEALGMTISEKQRGYFLAK